MQFIGAAAPSRDPHPHPPTLRVSPLAVPRGGGEIETYFEVKSIYQLQMDYQHDSSEAMQVRHGLY